MKKHHQPLLSIITVTYNAAEELAQTIQSVRMQTYPDIEYIIIDGLSKDNTLEIIEQYKSSITHWISEADRGIYDAMNKGLDFCTGDFCMFLNAGDVLREKTTLAQYVAGIDDWDTVYFSRASLTDGENQRFVPPLEVNVDRWLKQHEPNHQSMLFPRSFYEHERYDTWFHIAGDSDYKKRALKQLSYHLVNLHTIEYALGGLSNTYNTKTLFKRIRESRAIKERHHGYSRWQSLLFSVKFYVIFSIRNVLGDRYYQFLRLLGRYQKANGEH